jgi:integrase
VREKGEGHLRQREGSNTWFWVYKKKWHCLETDNKIAANKKRDEIKASFVTKGRYDPPSKDSFEEWNAFWLNQIVASDPELKQATYDDYESTIRVHINPELGEYQLKELTPEIMLTFYNKMRLKKKLSKKKDKKTGLRIPSDDPLSLRTLEKVQRCCKASLEAAIRMRKITENPNSFLDKSTTVHYHAPESKYLTSEEVLQFLEQNNKKYWYPLYVFPAIVTALGTGMRLGELAGLRWPNTDLKIGRIHVVEARKAVKNRDPKPGEGKTKIITQKTKSEKSTRYIPLPADVVAILRKLDFYQNKGVTRINKDSYVFAWSDGLPIRPDTLSKEFKKLIREFGRGDITFHDLRHSYATMLLEAGEEMKTLQELLGHANFNTTANIYTHILEKMKARSAERLNGFTERKLAKSRMKKKAQ